MSYIPKPPIKYVSPGVHTIEYDINYVPNTYSRYASFYYMMEGYNSNSKWNIYVYNNVIRDLLNSYEFI